VFGNVSAVIGYRCVFERGRTGWCGSLFVLVGRPSHFRGFGRGQAPIRRLVCLVVHEILQDVADENGDRRDFSFV